MSVNVWAIDDCSDATIAALQASVAYEIQIATAAQTLFTLSTLSYTPGANNISVYIQGVRQNPGLAYTETSPTTITFVSGLVAGDEVLFVTNDFNATASPASASSVTINSISTNVQSALNAFCVNTLADLKLINGNSGIPKALLWGKTSLGDTTIKEYYWDAASVDADNDITVIQATAITTGRWRLANDSYLPLITNILNGSIDSPLFDICTFVGLSSKGDNGGGLLYWNSATDKATADGDTIFDPSVILSLQGTGIGTGCYHRGDTYRSGAVTPVGAVTPLRTGEEYLDTVANTWYKSYGLLNTEWKAMTA